MVDRVIVESTASFQERWREHLKWFVEDETGSFRPFRVELARFSEKYLKDDGTAPSRSWMSHGAERKEQASVWSAYGSLPAGAHRARKYDLRWSAQELTGANSHQAADWDLALQEVLKLLRDQPILYAHAGLTFSELIAGSCDEKSRAVLARRFQGVDIGEIGSESLTAPRGFRCVSWLTALGNLQLEKIGGRPALARLSADIVVHELGTGVLIQLGERPSMGDVNDGDTLPLYRELTKVLMPIRYLGHIVWPNVKPEEAKAWIARFDP